MGIQGGAGPNSQPFFKRLKINFFELPKNIKSSFFKSTFLKILISLKLRMFKYIKDMDEKIAKCDSIVIFGESKTLKLTHTIYKHYRNSLADKKITVIDITGEIAVKNTQSHIDAINQLVKDFWDEVGINGSLEISAARDYLDDNDNKEEILETAKTVFENNSSKLPLIIPYVKKYTDNFLKGKISLKGIPGLKDYSLRIPVDYVHGDFPILDVHKKTLVIFNICGKVFKGKEFDFLFKIMTGHSFDYIIFEDYKTPVKIFDIIRQMQLYWHQIELQKKDDKLLTWCIVGDCI
jgi:hypothetical protein